MLWEVTVPKQNIEKTLFSTKSLSKLEGLRVLTYLQCYESVYVFIGSGSRFFSNTDPDLDCFPIRIQIQVKTHFLKALTKMFGTLVFN